MGDVFILDLGRNIYVWMPPKSGRLERIKAMSRAKNMAQVERQGESKVHIIGEARAVTSYLNNRRGMEDTRSILVLFRRKRIHRLDQGSQGR